MLFTVAWQNTTIENQVLRFMSLTKRPFIFNEESVGWNLNKRMLVSL